MWPLTGEFLVRGHIHVLRAEGVGFEPTMSITTHSGFKTAGHSAPDLLKHHLSRP